MSKNTKSSRAKKANTGSSPPGGMKKAPTVHAKPKGMATAATGRKPGYEYFLFTKKSVEFTARAADLADYVKSTYGEGVSITQYQKFLLHYAGTTDEERSRLWVDAQGIALSQAYEAAKTARDDERNSFRGDVQVADVQGTLASLATIFQGPNGPPKRRREDGEEMGGVEGEGEEPKLFN